MNVKAYLQITMVISNANRPVAAKVSGAISVPAGSSMIALLL